MRGLVVVSFLVFLLIFSLSSTKTFAVNFACNSPYPDCTTWICGAGFDPCTTDNFKSDCTYDLKNGTFTGNQCVPNKWFDQHCKSGKDSIGAWYAGHCLNPTPVPTSAPTPDYCEPVTACAPKLDCYVASCGGSNCTGRQSTFCKSSNGQNLCCGPFATPTTAPISTATPMPTSAPPTSTPIPPTPTTAPTATIPPTPIPQCANDIDCADGNPCTEDVCSGGSCSSTNKPQATACQFDLSSNPVMFCNASGSCNVSPTPTATPTPTPCPAPKDLSGNCSAD